MIKALRRKFIIISMCCVAAVLFAILGTINVANYIAVNRHANELLQVLEENGGAFPKQGDKNFDKKPARGGISPEAPFETRFFTVVLEEDQAVVSVNTGRIAAISTEAAAQFAVDLFAKNKTEGFVDTYKYRAVLHGEGVMYIFLDCGRELSTFHSFLQASLLAALLGIISVFALVVFFSKIATRPIAEGYEKQRRFITDASHEIKTPITIIGANAEMLEMENGESEWSRSIKKQTQSLGQLTEKLVFLSRMDEGGAALQMTDFSLSDAVLETAKPFEPVATSSGKKLLVEVENRVSYCGDEANLRQLLALLLDNAVKYASDGGEIRVRLRTMGRTRVITVFNTVDSIELGNHDSLFERFYRPDASRNSETGGNGIGLSVAKTIVAAHKGKISARSEDAKSILFTVTL